MREPHHGCTVSIWHHHPKCFCYKIIFEQIERHVWCDGFYFSDEIIFSRGLTWDDTASIDWISVHRLVSLMNSGLG